MKRIFIRLATLFVLLLSQQIFAGTGLFFNLSTSGSLMNLRTTIPHHFYPNAGIKFNTPGYKLTSCRAGAPGYCLFSVSDTQPASLLVSGPRGTASATLCLQGKEGPLSCQIYQAAFSTGTPRFAFIGNNATQVPSNNFHQCGIDPTTGNFTTCTDVPFGDFPLDFAFNSAGTFAYVSTALDTGSGGVYLCNVDPATGIFSGCATTGSGLGTFSPSVALNPAGTFAYVSDAGGNQVSKCDVDQTTGALSNCAATGSGFNQPFGITINPAGTFAYIGSAFFAGNLSVCAIDQGTGDLINCDTTDSGLDAPLWVAINPQGTLAYVVQDGSSNNIQLCRIDPTTGTLLSCFVTGDYSFSSPLAIEMNSAGTAVYVSDNSTENVIRCSVNQANGTLSGCAITGPTLAGAYGIGLYS